MDTRKRNKRLQNWWGRSKTVTIWDDVTVYGENPKDTETATTNKWIQSSFRYKINIQKPVAFLYTNNKLSEREN